MSTHNAKKKRMGSRRKAVNQNEIDEGNERPLTDTSAAESGLSGKTTEETEVLDDLDGSAALPSNWPSPQLKGSRRKFGSHRTRKGLHAGDVAPVLHNKEDDEEMTDNIETIQVSMEMQTQNLPHQSQKSETVVSADIHLHEPNPHSDSSELKDSGGEIFRTDEDFTHTSSENLAVDNTEKCSYPSKEIWINSPDNSGLSLSGTPKENMQPFMISVDADQTDEANDTGLREELSENECEGRKNDSELITQTEDFQSESPRVDDSWVQLNADFACSGKQKETFMPLEDGQNEHVGLQVDDHLTSVDVVDRIHTEDNNSNENHEIMHTHTENVTEEVKIMLQSELSTELSATKPNDLADEEIIHETTETLSDVDKVEILPSEVNVAHCQDEDTGPSVKGSVFSEVEQMNVSPETEQNVLPVSDYNHRFTENTMAKTHSNEAIATTTISSETEIEEDSMETIVKDVDPNLTENSSGADKKSIQTFICDDATKHFSTELITEGMLIDQSHVRDELEISTTVVSVSKEEGLDCENKQDEYQTERMAHRVLYQTSEECNSCDAKSTEVAGMDRTDTEPGGVYQTEDEENDGTETKGLDLHVQAILDLPPTQLEQVESVSDTVISRKESTVSLATESEVSDQGKETAQSVTHSERGLPWSADSCVRFDDDIEKLPDDDYLLQPSDSSLTRLNVVDQENIDPTLAGNSNDQDKESMQTDSEVLGDASEAISTDLPMNAMEIGQTHFTGMLEATQSQEDRECLTDDHSASELPQISMNVQITSEIDGSRDLAVAKNGISMVDLKEDNLPSVDGKGDYILEDVNESNVLSKTNCLEFDSKTVEPTSEKHHKYFGEEDKESAGTSLNDWEKFLSRTGDFSPLHHSIKFDEVDIETSNTHDGLKTSTNVSIIEGEELNYECKHEEKDFPEEFPETRVVSGRKLGSSRKKKLKPPAQDIDLSLEPAEGAGGHNDSHETLESTASLTSLTEASYQVLETAHGATHSDIAELDASNSLPSPTIEGKEREEDSDSSVPDPNRQRLASESQMQPTCEEALTVLMVPTEESKEKNQSSILPDEDMDHGDLPEGRGLLCSFEMYGNVDEEADKPPVDDSLILQSDSVLQSVTHGESRDSEPGDELLLFDKTVTDMEMEENSNARNGDNGGNATYETVNTDSRQGVETDLHPPFEKTLGENITINQASEEFAREVVSGWDEIAEKTSAQEENKDQLSVQEKSGKEPTASVPQEVQQLTTEGAWSLQHVDLQAQTKQKRRKMGSTRRANFSRQHEEEMCTNSGAKTTAADQNDLEKVEAVVECRDSKTDVSHGGISEESNNPQETIVHDNCAQSNTETSVSTAVVEGGVNSVFLAEVDDLNNGERNSDAVIEELKPGGLIIAERSSSLNPEGPTNTVEWSSESVDLVTQETKDDEDRLESLLSDQLLESTAKSIVTANLERVKDQVRGGDDENPNDVSEKVKADGNLETRKASLSLRSEARKRKMGSTRKSLASQRAGEGGGATEVQVLDCDAPKTQDNELTPQKVFVLETVERSCTTESYLRPQAATEEQQLGHSLTVPPAPLPDAVSETAAGGRRRKMGSHRKSHGYQRNRQQVRGQEETADTQPEASSGTLTSDQVTRTAQEKSSSLNSIPEDKDDKKTPLNTIDAKAAEQPKPVHGMTSTQETAAQQLSANRPGSSQSPEHPIEETLPSKSYNVILIGDSSVGKTSFMKRVQTGKFSLDLPASVGTDSCISSVLVDGKRVVLQLWDTAGQERFHSVTRQIFHKAQAFLLMYDITSFKSFSDVSYWANCIQESATDNVTIVMLGNKSDSATRQVQSLDGEVLAKEYDFDFMECSAATGHNVPQSLETVARALSEKHDTREEATVLRREPQKKQSSGCC